MPWKGCPACSRCRRQMLPALLPGSCQPHSSGGQVERMIGWVGSGRRRFSVQELLAPIHSISFNVPKRTPPHPPSQLLKQLILSRRVSQTCLIICLASPPLDSSLQNGSFHPIPPSCRPTPDPQDVYDSRGYAVRKDWVNGPNKVFRFILHSPLAFTQ